MNTPNNKLSRTTDEKVLAYITSLYNEELGYSWPKLTTIAEAADCSIRTAIYSTKRLSKAKKLKIWKVKRRGPYGLFNFNRYKPITCTQSKDCTEQVETPHRMQVLEKENDMNNKHIPEIVEEKPLGYYEELAKSHHRMQVKKKNPILAPMSLREDEEKKSSEDLGFSSEKAQEVKDIASVIEDEDEITMDDIITAPQLYTETEKEVTWQKYLSARADTEEKEAPTLSLHASEVEAQEKTQEDMDVEDISKSYSFITPATPTINPNPPVALDPPSPKDDKVIITFRTPAAQHDDDGTTYYPSPDGIGGWEVDENGNRWAVG